MDKVNKRNIKINLSYDGREYSGWQTQKHIINVQSVLEHKISKILKDNVKIIGIGRTDAGAHAICFTANFRTTNHTLPVEKMTYVFNNVLPKDIKILTSEEVEFDFHSRYQANAREYVYFIINARNSPPFYHAYAHIEYRPLEIKLIKNACRLFKGVHNFKNYCYGYDSEMNYIREIFYLRAKKINHNKIPTIIFFIKGSGFLRGMIRSIISVCLNHALGKVSLETIEKSLNNEIKLESKIKAMVPAGGLYFKRGYFKKD